jgi:hypothetical protein
MMLFALVLMRVNFDVFSAVHWSVIAASIGMDMKRINTYKLLDLFNVVSGEKNTSQFY